MTISATKNLRSPLARIGGKGLLAGWLSEKIPEHTLYCEPFCGAGHLLFSKTPSQVEVINDIDNHLVNFFKIIQEPGKCQMLTNLLDYMPYSRNLWQELRTQWKQCSIPGDPVEASAQWFYLNRTCFSGDQKRGGFAVPSTTGRNPAQSFRTAIDTFDDIARRLRNVTIENLPYAECIKRYDSETTLFYCDPPYLNSEHYYGKDSFGQDDHRTLAGLLHGIKGKVMITHYQNSLYDELYRGWHRHEYSSFKGSHKSTGESKPKTVECLWTNFEREFNQ
ncbi:MAG: DNA adenine methylase [Candidatus Brocadia sp. AMX2]|nr:MULTISPECIES: DNA adenine methylase [Brocadia]MBC6931545.1 DNA adenine methylase [Candidatus Brocadia sp.]MBL1169186.1 DNA adenine methylase [Candidatus Brocadia sp. AMX1]NOG42919.1 DNA adenine methylase [Planctomycetota bacterium]KAA0242509.1 MAG: DNA adenine methylase [Candidatus Brocadia sp. AMX2]MCE7866252.1 DNA adenine methylase [Candidatus Brocadia sp. AMX2]